MSIFPIYLHAQVGGKIRAPKKIRILVPVMVTLLFVLSALFVSGVVSAGKRDQKPAGTCFFDKSTYTLGETMTIYVRGWNGNPDKAFFQLLLRNPSGQTVGFYELYAVTEFTDVVYYAANQAGHWTADLTYTVAGKRHSTTTTLVSTGADVI